MASEARRFFLSCIAFSDYVVVRVACLLRSWFVYIKNKPTTCMRLTSHANEFINAKSHTREKPLPVGQNMVAQ